MDVLLFCRGRQRVLLCITVSLLLVLVGCAGVNRVVTPEKRIALVSGERQQGTYTQGRESLSYAYLADKRQITIEGEVYPNRSIDFMKIRLLFLNQQGSIMAGEYVYTSPYRSHGWKQNSFEKSVLIPENAQNISFDFYVKYRIRR